MATTTTPSSATPLTAIATMRNVPISTKHAVMVCRSVRYQDTASAKKLLNEVMALKTPIAYPRSNFDLGHRRGIGPGRYPQKVAREVLRLIKSAEANAQVKGLTTTNLKITKLMAHKASIPFTGNRWFHRTKRSHLEIEVQERKVKERKVKETAKEGKKEEGKAGKARMEKGPTAGTKQPALQQENHD